MNLLVFCIIGLVAGWVASQLMRGRGLGIIGNLVVGLVGAVIGGYLLGMFGVHTAGIVGELVTAVIGAMVLLAVVRLFSRATT